VFVQTAPNAMAPAKKWKSTSPSLAVQSGPVALRGREYLSVKLDGRTSRDSPGLAKVGDGDVALMIPIEAAEAKASRSRAGSEFELWNEPRRSVLVIFICIAEFGAHCLFFRMRNANVHDDEDREHNDGKDRRPHENEAEHDRDKSDVLRMSYEPVGTARRRSDSTRQLR
jgi:hypothetical protein